MKRITQQRQPSAQNQKKKVTAKKGKKKTERASLGRPTQSGDPDLINNLNDDCLARIFKYLPLNERLRLETVCKRWKDVTELAWDDIKMLGFTPDFPAKNYLSILPRSCRTNQFIGRIIRKCGRYLHRLQVTRPCNNTILPLVGEHCHNLVRLELDLFYYDKTGAQLFLQMERLKYLEIKGVRQNFPGAVIVALPQTLTEIHLWAHLAEDHLSTSVFLPRVTPKVLLSLTNLTALTFNGFSLKPNMIKIISQMAELTFLSIANCSLRLGLPRLKALTKLEHLNLTKLIEVDNNYLREIVDNCPNIKHLNLSKCISVDSSGISNLLGLSHLEELIVNDVFKITDAPFVGMDNLKKLQCKNCGSVSNTGIVWLIKYSPNFEYLNVAYTGVDEQVLHEATRITKARTNNLQLHIVVSKSVKEMWYEHAEDYSPLVFIEGMGSGFFDVSDPDTDMDDYSAGEDDYDDIYDDDDDFDLAYEDGNFDDEWPFYFPRWA